MWILNYTYSVIMQELYVSEANVGSKAEVEPFFSHKSAYSVWKLPTGLK